MRTGGLREGHNLHKLRVIHRGETPVHLFNAPCNRCRYKEWCEESGGTG
jgi:CRISPR/Cas system-associated exonuclease Cas4 (RecB family)